jgi:hypothetical protein
MTDIIHMEDPEIVREVGRMLGRLAEKISDAQTEISRSSQGMDWDGSAKDYFLQDVEIWAGKMYGLSQRSSEKMTAVIKEADEWENAAKKFGWGPEGYTPFVLGDDDSSVADETDIDQGTALGDCFLLSSLGSIAQHHPEFIEDMIEVLPDGRCRVRFYDKWCIPPFGPCTYTEHWVIVEMDFSPGPQASPTDGGTEAWAMIIEKGYYQWRKENNQLIDLPSPAVALSAITGKDSINYPTLILNIDDLYQKFQRGDAITAASLWDIVPEGSRPPAYQDGATPQIGTGHVYFVTGIDPVNNTVTLQNPWGPELPPIEMSFSDYQNCFWLTTTNQVV